eukprot:gnl/MRDRNA2_/MRDRNA2_81988_c0_seq1.p1 gnl/MRDRNA2_/MRDRNA2_81988_c0~~gnl/MRDRNA2_/MRDRNA2_81988_c0_seq1.p1  ORF type:complete len:417 (-),score=65.14 gnl/MRDRNA2_/MRDRNA2_81988_c0_seq1:262-1512(-)
MRCLIFLGFLTGAYSVAISPKDGCVVLTGVNGFLAGYIAEELLKKGYTVHGTMRPSTIKRESAWSHLKEMDERLPGTLKVFPAEMGEPGIYDEASKGCSTILATAYYIPKGMDDAEAKTEGFFQWQVDSGINGTLAALEAADKFGIKKVVQTSSVAACSPTKAKLGQTSKDPPYTEADWNDVASLGYLNYPYGKTVAEKAFYDYAKKNPKGPQVSSILFPFGVAPPMNPATFSSLDLFRSVLKGETGFLFMNLYMYLVDMRDVARAHVHLMEHDKGEGRYIISMKPNPYPMTRTLELYRKHFPDFPLPSIPMPRWFLNMFLNLGFPGLDPGMVLFGDEGPGYDGTKISKELGFKYMYTDEEAILVEMARGIIKLGGAAPGKPADPKLFAGVAILVIVLLIAGCRFCCCRSRKVKAA